MILDQFSFNSIFTKKLTFLYEKCFDGTRAHFFHLHELYLKTKETKTINIYLIKERFGKIF